MNDLVHYMTFALDMLDTSGPRALRYFRKADSSIEDKGKAEGRPFDPVTQADRELESYLRERITKAFPDHGIVGEEFPAREGSGDFQWVIDPIDGTRAFISGFPAWGTLLALLQEGEPVLGFMHQPFVGETFFGDSKQAWVKSARSGATLSLAASSIREVSNATLYSTHPDTFTQLQLRGFEHLARDARLWRYGGDCYIYCLLAHGLIDVTVEGSLKPHDILPLIPIVRGAGGVVTGEQGRSPNQGGLIVAAATESLHQQALAYMNPGE